MGKKPHHGIALPLSALRNPEGGGCGEFLDLIPIIEWCKSIGFDVIQLLPLNDSECDPSPYNAISANALHPMYISIAKLPFLEKVVGVEKTLNKLREFGSGPRFSYNQVRCHKEHFLRFYFDTVFEHIELLPEYQKFISENTWLENYALFKVLKMAHDEHPWWDFGSYAMHPNEDFIVLFKKEFEKEICFHKMEQFLAFSQWEKVKWVAELHGVYLKGDIPILISRDSCDVWASQELFHLEYAAGAPPDFYSSEGQNWGFPIYNWLKAEECGYQWWKERLRVAQKLYHLYRIDHIVGFYRIWAIPHGKTAREGFFIPQNKEEWLSQGEKCMRMLLSASTMIPIGEDLGAVPAEVRKSLHKLGIPRTKVQRWERRWDTDKSYIPLSDYPRDSMTTVSTHDSETLSGWWQNGDDDARAYCAFKKWDLKALQEPLSYDMRYEMLADSHASNSMFHINLLQEYLNLFPKLSWDTPEDERINIPGVVLDQNWTYRFRPSIQEIISNKKLAASMQSLQRGLTEKA